MVLPCQQRALLYSHHLIAIGFKSKDDDRCKKIHALAGAFIKEELEDVQDKKTILYPFSLFFMHQKKTFNSYKKEDRAEWVKVLKAALGYANLYDFYELKVLIHATK